MFLTDPFRYHPDELVIQAARQVMELLEGWSHMPEHTPEGAAERSMAEGKMMGVLVLEDGSHIAAFSGTVRGADGKVTADIGGFVPPICNITDPEGYFKKEEAVISRLNADIEVLENSAENQSAQQRLLEAEKQMSLEISLAKEKAAESKARREETRKSIEEETEAAKEMLARLTKESQFEKAELKRLKDRWKQEIENRRKDVWTFKEKIDRLKAERAELSDNLQKWIFRNSIVHNAAGESATIWDIFERSCLIPPGGTGECAAPKLLEYAYRHSLKPLAMGEFWYGKSPDTAVRTHGHFYPSCTSKCGPLLGFMMKGLRHRGYDEEIRSESTDTSLQSLIVNLYDDASIIVVEKPGGMPSVPGLDGRKSVQEHLLERYGIPVHAVHRLDMDTSGVMIFAKTEVAAAHIRKQFEEHTVQKTYIARVSSRAGIPSSTWRDGMTGSIDLPLSPDYDERPRQKVDFRQGKPAQTTFEVIQTAPDGTSDLLMYPLTGRTHQLRVHCAHHSGLGRPILGDMLYGGAKNNRLCLHALSITLKHPETETDITFTSERLSFRTTSFQEE